jgi:hypothetical protein
MNTNIVPGRDGCYLGDGQAGAAVMCLYARAAR